MNTVKIFLVSHSNEIVFTSKSHWHVPKEVLSKILHLHDDTIQNYAPSVSKLSWPTISFNSLIKYNNNNMRLIVVQRVTSINSELNAISWLIWGIIVIALFVGLVGIYIGFFVKKRLSDINDSCRLIIESSDLSQRIQRDGTNKDFDILVKNLNHLLAHNEQLVSDIKQVNNNIAHDLRTPLTRIKNKLEGVMSKPLSLQELEGFHLALKKDLENLNKVFNTLLRISRLESEQDSTSIQHVDVNMLLTDIVEFYQPLAEEKGQKINLNTTKLVFKCDKDLLFQALANCIENAIKYTPRSGKITIMARQQIDQVSISICDDGIGIPAKEREKVFQRLYRVDSSRSTEGNGLGLALVKAIVELHHGTVSIASNNPGTCITLSFPNN
ncbi:sensor histidine kinase [Thalassotalea ganghwensis]